MAKASDRGVGIRISINPVISRLVLKNPNLKDAFYTTCWPSNVIEKTAQCVGKRKLLLLGRQNSWCPDPLERYAC